MKFRVFAILGLSIALLGLTEGCSSSGHDRAASTAESMGALSQRLDKATAQIDTVLGSLDGITAAAEGGDLAGAYKKFSGEVESIDSAAESARSRYASMKTKAEEHFKAWEGDSATLSDPNLQQAAANRREKAHAAFSKVVEASAKAKENYEPFISNLKDINAFLAADLTSQAVKTLGSNIKKAKNDGENLKKSIESMKEAIAKVRAELTTVAPAPATK